mmetsp:Transcript_2322/g.6926  ORF Transcript_2322/g.6926 Transcript_2322/m.6926 type:complete len:329 (-) Transcript_2322:2250-3236(-)
MAVESLPASFLEELIVDLDPGLDVAALDSMWDLKGQLESGHAGQVNLGPQSGEYGGPAPSQPSATGTGHGDSSGIQTPPLYNDWRMTPIQRPEDFNDNFPALSDPDHHYNGNANQTSTPFYSTASEQLAALRERSRNNQRRYRSKQRDKLKEAEELVAQLTAQLKASKLEQEALTAELAGHKAQEATGSETADLDRHTSRTTEAGLDPVDDPDAWWLDDATRDLFGDGNFVCSLPGGPAPMSFKQLRSMTDEEMAKLWVKYIVAFAERLLRMQGSTVNAADAILELVRESDVFWAAVMLKAPDDLRRLWVCDYGRTCSVPTPYHMLWN